MLQSVPDPLPSDSRTGYRLILTARPIRTARDLATRAKTMSNLIPLVLNRKSVRTFGDNRVHLRPQVRAVLVSPVESCTTLRVHIAAHVPVASGRQFVWQSPIKPPAAILLAVFRSSFRLRSCSQLVSVPHKNRRWAVLGNFGKRGPVNLIFSRHRPNWLNRWSGVLPVEPQTSLVFCLTPFQTYQPARFCNLFARWCVAHVILSLFRCADADT